MTYPLRVLHLFGRMDRGGAELRTLDVIRRLDPTQVQTHICVLSGLQGELDQEVLRAGGMMHYVRLDSRFPWRFLHLIRSQRIDVVHSHVYLATGAILLLAKLAGVQQRIAHFRCSQDDGGHALAKRLRHALLRRLIDRYATRIAAVSNAAMRSAWREDYQHDPRCEVVYNGINLAPFEGACDRTGVCQEFDLPHNCVLYIHVGNVRPSKNHAKVLAIFAEIIKRQPEARLLLAGRGADDKSSLLQQIQQRSLCGLVRLAGVRHDVPRLLRAADLLLFPSLHEGLPGVLLEAAAAGVPALASDLSVVREISPFLAGIRSLSVTEDDATWANLAQEIVKSTSPTLRDAWAKSFKQSPFTLDASVAAHLRIWESDCSGPPALSEESGLHRHAA